MNPVAFLELHLATRSCQQPHETARSFEAIRSALKMPMQEVLDWMYEAEQVDVWTFSDWAHGQGRDASKGWKEAA